MAVTTSIPAPSTDFSAVARQLADQARDGFLSLLDSSPAARDQAIRLGADEIEKRCDKIISANEEDLAAAEQADLSDSVKGRLRLDATKISTIASALREIADQPNPVGRTLHAQVRPNGLRVEKRTVPIGVVFFIYESRPNVTADAAALCLKSGNAVILRGGKEAARSSRALYDCMRVGIRSAGLPEHAVQLVESTDRALVGQILAQSHAIDLAIPRGGEGLIRAVVDQAKMPVLKHYDGNCHIYIHADAADWPDGPEAVTRMLVNAKTSHPGGGVCNAVEHVLVHRRALPLLGPACDALSAAGVEVRGDEAARQAWPRALPIREDEWGQEYLSLVVGVKVVDSLNEAVAHINHFGSRHTDGILTRDVRAADAFVARVDSANVMVNASTRFADGGQYGLGAEIGISTDKLHARGPMGAADLCTYKWIVTGDGHCRA